MLTKYFIKHWQGQYSLQVSFWINFIFIFIALQVCFLLVHNTLPKFPNMFDVWRYVILVSVLIFLSSIIIIWQTVGTWRSTRQRVNTHKNITKYLYRLILICGSVFVILQVVLHYLPTKKLFFIAIQHNQLTKTKYKISVFDNHIKFVGPISFGAADAIETILKKHKTIKEIWFDSRGGFTSVAMKMSDIISRYHLDTYVHHTCDSACTIAFVAGTKRTLSPQGHLGFHRPYMNGLPISYISMSVRDIQSFIMQRGVSYSFVQRVFKVNSDELWYPDHRQLISSRYVTKIEHYLRSDNGKLSK